MTGYTVHTGASKKFVAGWDRIFEAEESDPKSGSAGAKKKAASKKAGKKSPKKKAAKAAAKASKKSAGKKASGAKGR
ncbi:MAG: hypothetical protein NXI04_19895 [Planctomycetaceae bacterium]|nr:hypothetical protein [Planctomycetaceae bacterium]